MSQPQTSNITFDVDTLRKSTLPTYPHIYKHIANNSLQVATIQPNPQIPAAQTKSTLKTRSTTGLRLPTRKTAGQPASAVVQASGMVSMPLEYTRREQTPVTQVAPVIVGAASWVYGAVARIKTESTPCTMTIMKMLPSLRMNIYPRKIRRVRLCALPTQEIRDAEAY